jgi:transcription-repair coupling factor (superfamily II helicase)
VTELNIAHDISALKGPVTLAAAPEGLDALALSDLARAGRGVQLHIARDDLRLARLADALSYFAPELEILRFPAWDCQPYDRVSPNAAISARRLASLARLCELSDADDANEPVIVLTTVNATLQRLPPRDALSAAIRRIRPGQVVDIANLTGYLATQGYVRVSTVRDAGEFAVRGGVVDLFAPGSSNPVRLDLFGDVLETIRAFDTETQRTTAQLKQFTLLPAGELPLDDAAVSSFRMGYTSRFGAVTGADALYEAISERRRYQGMEHWLPLFYQRMASLFDYADFAAASLDHLANEAAASRLEQIADYYDARLNQTEGTTLGGAAYNPLEPHELYLSEQAWRDLLAALGPRQFSPFEQPETTTQKVISLDGRLGRNFSAEREQADVNVFDAAARHIAALQAQGKRVVICSWSEGATARLEQVLADHGVERLEAAADWRACLAAAKNIVSLAVLGLEHGFETSDLAVVAEQDILGDRMVRKPRRRKPSDALTELSSLSPGDFVVHADHGIGRFEGLRAIDVQGAPHDCLYLTYHGGDRLFLPVENLELLTRYGGEEGAAQLDRLGGAAWQARKSRLKARIREIAQDLIATAARRMLRKAEIMTPEDGIYQEFAARFPFEETDDQLNAIDDVVADLAGGRPMDRLICGDVGFGKTEIALRSAFIAALAGKQTAVIVPTTLLARQHHATFVERFRGLPVQIAHLSRLVPAADRKEAREGLANGEVDIVIGTHALLAKNISFKDLGLVVVDEEQHFGVSHKEKLKALKAQVHVLTLTATPIPRTLQLALTGVRDLSLIATAPVDRLAVRTFISPFDPVVVREALLRELYRGGQSFYVCPRISDLEEIAAFLREQVPEVKFATAHGQLAPGRLDDIMSAFYDRDYDVLLSTTIIESGLDIPTANTLIVHRAEMFGLSQLYQLRGRVGRSKIRAYALFTVPPNKTLTETAERRLKVLQSLDTLGAGFSLASHDLDIRGAGNLLGEEQSGHIKEVGFELYQQMLEEAVAQLRDDPGGHETKDQYSPQLNLGVSVLIPENYIGDLSLRLSLYRRLSALDDNDGIDEFKAELTDRFGPCPAEVDHLLDTVRIKVACRIAGVETVDAGAKGAVISFRDNKVANPAGLIGFIEERADLARLRPDHKLVYKRDWANAETRLTETHNLIRQLARIVQAA